LAFCAPAFAMPAVTLAQHSAPPPAPVYRPAQPVARPAEPIPRPANPEGFDFPHDVNAPPPQIHTTPLHPAPGYRVAPQTSAVRSYPPRVPYASGPYRNWRGPIVYNPRRWRWWQWNDGVVWYPVPYYWGGGFWGPWVLGVTGAALFGAIVDSGDQEVYGSYEIGPESPGAQLLEDYGLTQTECGPPNLVVIWGPDGSVICAYPNQVVEAGSYEVDPASLTLQALAPNP
jgi:hypothetical protein